MPRSSGTATRRAPRSTPTRTIPRRRSPQSGTDVDDATARVIVRTAAAELCPAASAAGLSPTAPPATPTAQPDETGRPFANGGITLTVKKASTTDTIEMNESNFRPGSGYERYTKTKSGGDAKFVVVEAHVVNNAKTSLDLTCSLPINTRLVDEQQRNFDPIEDL